MNAMFALVFLLWPDIPSRWPDLPTVARWPELPVVVTAAEKAIDQRFLEKFHWRLSPGSCGMMGCAVHGGGWIKERERVTGRTAAEESGTKVDALPLGSRPHVTSFAQSPSLAPQTTTRWERRGLFRRVQVTVPLETTPRPEVPVKPAYKTGSFSTPQSCPNGQCLLRY